MTNKVQAAAAFAHQLLPDVINPFTLCNELGIEVIWDKDMHKDGYLICEEGCKLIFVSSRITNAHRRKFIISHEIGHFLMHREQMYCCTNISEIETGRINSSTQEREANSFASEYLLPKSQLTRELPKNDLTFTDISRIADLFCISMTFCAIKAVQFSNSENEILLCYEGQMLKWFSSSDKSLSFDRIPQKCPIELVNCKASIDTNGVWDSLFDGTVHQEIFRPVQNQSLVLLSGQRRFFEEVSYEY